MPMIVGWASALLASVLVARGRTAEAAPLIAHALHAGPPLARYDARLAQAELARARGDPDATALALRALQAARAGGHGLSVPALERLALAAPA